MKDENVYIREDNGRYKPVGVFLDKDMLYDGVWYVRHRPGGRSVSNVPYMASLFHVRPNPVNLNILCSMHDMQDKVFKSDEWKEIMNRKQGYSLSDIVATVIKVIYNNSEIQ